MPRRNICLASSLLLIAVCVLPVAGRAQQIAEASLPRAEAAPPLSTPQEYRVNDGDELDVSVWGEERMQRTVRVLPDGNFAFPLIGTVQAAGRSVGAISDEISDRLSVNYRTGKPSVTVTVRDTAGMRFYVVGKVRTPGGFTANRAVDVVQALSLAGGLADFADVKHAVILRSVGDGQSVEPVRLAAVLKGRRGLHEGNLAVPLPKMHSGDVLVIP